MLLDCRHVPRENGLQQCLMRDTALERNQMEMHIDVTYNCGAFTAGVSSPYGHSMLFHYIQCATTLNLHQ